MPRIGAKNALLLILVGAVIVRLLLFGYLLVQERPDFFILSDSNGYIQLADNLVAGNGFSQSAEPPYLPDSMRTPGYPFTLASAQKVFGSFTPVILLQIALSAALVLLAYRIAFLVSKRESLALIAAGLMAFEPYSIFVNTSLITETLFAFFLMAGSYSILRFLQEPRALFIVAASALYGVAALVRPIGEFLPAVLIFIVLMRMPVRDYIRYIAFAVIPFLLVVGPWLIRNQVIFGVPVLSSGGLQNVYSDLGAAVISYRDHVSWSEAKLWLEEDYARRHDFDVLTIQQDLSRSPDLFKEGINIVLTHPVETLKVFTSITITFFTNDAWTYYPQKWELMRPYDWSFSPSYTLMTEGPVATFHKVVEETGSTLTIPLVGRIFWVAVSALFLLSSLALIVRGGREREYALFFLLLAVYLLGLSASVGFGINGRFRYPMNAIFFTGAAIGGTLFLNWVRSKYALFRRHTGVRGGR